MLYPLLPVCRGAAGPFSDFNALMPTVLVQQRSCMSECFIDQIDFRHGAQRNQRSSPTCRSGRHKTVQLEEKMAMPCSNTCSPDHKLRRTITMPGFCFFAPGIKRSQSLLLNTTTGSFPAQLKTHSQNSKNCCSQPKAYISGLLGCDYWYDHPQHKIHSFCYLQVLSLFIGRYRGCSGGHFP